MEQANEAQSVKSEIQTMKIGWLMDYDHPATLACIESTEIWKMTIFINNKSDCTMTSSTPLLRGTSYTSNVSL